MAEENRGASRLQIALAIIGLVGVLGGAVIANWDKIFPKPTAGKSFGSKASTASERDKGFRVVEAILRADPFDYSGPCPATIQFSGRISVIGGSGTVSYRFIRSDGASAPVQILTFDGPGSKDVSEAWHIGGAGTKYSGWEAIKVLEPTEIESTHANFKINCQ